MRVLVADLIAEGVEATVPVTVRETVEAVEKLVQDSDEDWTTNKALAKTLNIDKAAASRRARSAINRGYLENLEDRKGRPAQLVIGEDMPEDQNILPAAEELKDSGCTVDRVLEGNEHPPPPFTANGVARLRGGGSGTSPNNASTDQSDDGRERFAL